MRRNLRLDWRALALLGALLSIIIDWPGLVYAMPTILPPVADAQTAKAACLDTLNVIQNDSLLNYFPGKQNSPAVAAVQSQQKDNNIKNEFRNEHFNRFPTKTMSAAITHDTATETKELQPQQRLTTTITEKQQVNENRNSISDSVKQLNDNKQTNEQLEITAIHETQDQQNLLQDEAANESVALKKVSLANTHTENSTINMISSTKFTNSAQPTTTTTSLIFTTTTESSAKIQSTLMPTTAVESSSDDHQQSPSNSNFNTQNIFNNFQIFSSNHLAILSRTERSIRSPVPSSASSLNASPRDGTPLVLSGSDNSRSSSSRGSRSSSAVGGVLVRRSPDMSVMKSKRLSNSRNLHHKNNLDRNERSTVSHLSGPSRKIQLYIKNRFIQLMPDGTVNGTQDEQCDYTILQRSTVEVGRIKIQGVATCLYLCMDPCGAVYGSKEFTDDCVFNESMEQHNYNTYSSTYNSNTRRKYYLALNRHGEPRKLQIPPSRSLGKLATYTNAIPETVPQERVEQLIAKNFGANRVKHGIRQLCDTGKPLIELIDSKNFKARPKCNPNNSNNNSNSKNTLSRNLDKDNNNKINNNNSLGSFSNQQHTSSSGQVLNNVPVANDKNNLSSSSRSSSSSNSNHPETNRDSSSSSSPSSISISQNNGHISNSSSNSSSNSRQASSSSSSHSDSLSATGGNSSHRGGKKTGKKRKCRRFENEEQHNCTTPLNRPTSFTKRGNQLGPLRQQKCQNLLLQQQQAGVVDIVLPPMCTKKGGPKKQQGNNRKGHGKNGLGADGFGAHNRRGKKLNSNKGGGGPGKQASKNNSNNGGTKKKQKNSKRGGPNIPNRKNNKKSPTTTTEKSNANSSTFSTQNSSTSTLKPKLWETTSLMPSTTLFENYDPHAESTSDRGDREQRNVRYSNSMEEYMDQSSEDTSAGEDPDDDENDMLEHNDDMNDDVSYEDDSYAGPSSSHHPHTAAESSNTPFTAAGSNDFLYYDQLDSLPVGLWKFIAVLWILVWSLQTLS